MFMLGVLRVKSHAHWTLDGSPSCERVKTGDESEGGKHLKL